MISIVTCCATPRRAQSLRRNIASTIGLPFEHVVIDNSDARYGLCAAYNEGVRRSRGTIVVFVHDDVLFLSSGWGAVLENRFRDPGIGLVGVAGTQYLGAGTPYWVGAGSQFCRGRILHQLDNPPRTLLTVFNWDEVEADVAVLDGVFIAVHRRVLETTLFDEQTLRGFHFYDLDFCLSARSVWRIVVTWDILLAHRSAGTIGEAFHREYAHFSRKWEEVLPVQCAPGTPRITDGSDIGNYPVEEGTDPRTLTDRAREAVACFMDTVTDLVEKGEREAAIKLYRARRPGLAPLGELLVFDATFARLPQTPPSVQGGACCPPL